MIRRIRTATRIAALTALLLLAAPAQAANPVGDQIFDAVILRPMGFCQLAVGSAFLLVAYPLSQASGQADEALERLVTEPFESTFRKPLGDL